MKEKQKQTKQMKKLFSAIRNHAPLAGLVVAAGATFLTGCDFPIGRPLGGAMPRPLGGVVLYSQEETGTAEKSEKDAQKEVKPAPATTDSKQKDPKHPEVKDTGKDKKPQK